MKVVRFVGDSRTALSRFPVDARNRAGHELFMVQVGREPDDWKPVPTIGAGVAEIRVKKPSGAFRVIYVARFEYVIYVLHAFQKKTRKTAMLDVRLAKRRYRDVVEIEAGGDR